ncbi:MAG: T9SS type A sorting domain-containing protein [Bacteroidetes bacterium]|nr:T9SS type A sorting domain-containing protein [Bacteroidota bacterium]
MKKLLLLFTALAYLQCLHAQNWNEKLKAVASDRAANDLFGWAVSVSGDYAIVGAKLNDVNVIGGDTLLNAGAAYIFEMDSTGNWIQKQKIVASDRAAGDWFGWSVSISGNYAIIGVMDNATNVLGVDTLSYAGAAYIFERNTGGVWTQKQKIVASDRAINDLFGWSVSISSNYAIIGSRENSTNDIGDTVLGAGAAYLFERDQNGSWIQKQKIFASDRVTNAWFGCSVSISNNYAIVGASSSSHVTKPLFGSAYLFERDSGIWVQKQKISGQETLYIFQFGVSVSISGNYAIVGGDSSPKIIERDSLGIWKEKQKIILSDEQAFVVAISGNYALVGFGGNNKNSLGADSLKNAGAVFLFKRDNNGNWIQQQKIVTSDRTTADMFGGVTNVPLGSNTLAIFGNYVLVGAVNNSTNVVGGDTLLKAGAAYFFEPCVPVTSSQTLTVCAGQSVTVGANTYTASGTYTDTLTAVNTCDSIVTTNLTVNQLPKAGFTSSFLSCSQATWFFSDTSLTDIGDSIIAWNWDLPGGNPSNSIDSVSGWVNYYASGLYTVCLTVTSLHGCTDSSCAVVNAILGSVNSTTLESYTSIFPNPTSGEIEVISGISDISSVEVYSLLGERVYSGVWSDVSNQLQSTTTLGRLAGDSTQVQNIMCRTASGSSQLQTKTNNAPQIMSVDLSSKPNGIYFLQLKTSEGTTVKKIVVSR